MPDLAVAPPPSAANAASDAAAMGGSRGSSTGLLGKNMESAFSSLDRRAKEPSAEPGKIPAHPSQIAKEASAKAREEAKNPPSPEPPKEPAAETETETPPAETAKTPEPPKQPDKVKKPADFLREKLSKTEQERDTFKAELEKVKSATPTEDPEKKSLAEKLQATEARLKQMDDEMRFVNYEKSTEYKERYEKPYHDAWQSGRNWVSRLKANGDDGNPRQATPQDFDAMAQMAMQDPDAAANALEVMFGPTKAATIAAHITKVLDAGRTMTEALEHYRKEGGVRAQQSQEQQTKLHQELESVWKSAIDPKTVPDKFKPWVLPKGADEQGNPLDKEGDELLTRGLAEFDKAQSEDARDPRLTPDQRKAIINRAAAIRNKAANFPRLVRWLEQREAKIAELEKALKGYQTSEPGTGEGRAETKTTGPNGTMDSVFANLDKKAQARFY